MKTIFVVFSHRSIDDVLFRFDLQHEPYKYAYRYISLFLIAVRVLTKLPVALLQSDRLDPWVEQLIPVYFFL